MNWNELVDWRLSLFVAREIFAPMQPQKQLARDISQQLRHVLHETILTLSPPNNKILSLAFFYAMTP